MRTKTHYMDYVSVRTLSLLSLPTSILVLYLRHVGVFSKIVALIFFALTPPLPFLSVCAPISG